MKKFLICLLLPLLVGCGLITDGINYTDRYRPRYFQIKTEESPPAFDGTLKVVTYNIRFSQKPDIAGELLRDNEALADADIVLLQEMDAEGVDRIAEKLGFNYIYYPAVRHPLYDRDFGNAILTRWPIIYDQKVILPHLDPDKLQRIAVGAVLKIDTKYVMVYSVHMRIWLHPFQRKNQMARLLHSIPPYFDHCIIGGDFNTFTEFNQKVIFDAFDEHSFELATGDVEWSYKHWYFFNKKSLMDYIFVKNMDVIDAGKVLDRKASDHLPIWTEVRFGKI